MPLSITWGTLAGAALPATALLVQQHYPAMRLADAARYDSAPLFGFRRPAVARLPPRPLNTLRGSGYPHRCMWSFSCFLSSLLWDELVGFATATGQALHGASIPAGSGRIGVGTWWLSMSEQASIQARETLRGRSLTQAQYASSCEACLPQDRHSEARTAGQPNDRVSAARSLRCGDSMVAAMVVDPCIKLSHRRISLVSTGAKIPKHLHGGWASALWSDVVGGYK